MEIYSINPHLSALSVGWLCWFGVVLGTLCVSAPSVLAWPVLVLVGVGVFPDPGTPAAAVVAAAADVDVSPSGAPEPGFVWAVGAGARLG